MKNILLEICFDGTSYHGWQKQNNARTIQGTLEEAYHKLTGMQIQTTGCSRTDAGVHAHQFFANFRSESQIPVERICRALNTVLSKDIRVLKSLEVKEDFNSRFSAKDKTYVYLINTAKIENPFFSRFAYFNAMDINVQNMQKAADEFIGTHEFDAFVATGGSHHTTERTIKELTVKETEYENIIRIEITADAYLYNMVRIIAGTLLHVGIGKKCAMEIPDIIKSKNRIHAGATLPAHGLHLMKVRY